MAVAFGQYWELTKPRVVALLVFTALVGMFLSVPGLPPLRESVFGLLGIWLAASSAAAISGLRVSLWPVWASRRRVSTMCG